MQLLINTNIRRSIITIELETINFTKRENELLDQFGEYVFDFEKVYQHDFAVSIHKKVRSNFKLRIKFDGSKNEETMKKATLAANEFIEEIQEALDEGYEDWLYNKEELLEQFDNGLGATISTIVKQDSSITSSSNNNNATCKINTMSHHTSN